MEQRLRANRKQARALEPMPIAMRKEESPADADEGDVFMGGVHVSAPVGPSADEESAYLTEPTVEMPLPRRTVVREDDEPAVALPELDELMKRVPVNVREKMEELFRAKFVRVQRVPKRSLKS